MNDKGKQTEASLMEQVEYWLTDIYGSLKSIHINDASGNLSAKGFDGSSVPGMAPIENSDILVEPDQDEPPRELPWRSSRRKAYFCNILDVTGQPYEKDIRHRLKDLLKRYDNYQFTISAKLEFYLFHSNKHDSGIARSEKTDHNGYFDLLSARVDNHLLDKIAMDAKHLGIGIEQYHHEAENSQFAIDLLPVHPVRLADNLVCLRHLLRRRALEHGLHACFAPKPIQGQEGSALKFCICVSEHDRCALTTQPGSQAFTDLGKSFLAGLREYAREMMPLTNQWVNSYKRLQYYQDQESNYPHRAPIFFEFSKHSNQTAIQTHVCGQRNDDPDLARLGIRVSHPDAACNPYLTLIGLLSAGMSQSSFDNFTIHSEFDDLQSDTDQKNDYLRPRENLQQALNDFENGRLSTEILGTPIKDTLIHLKRKEAEQYEKHVTTWEQERYLGLL